MKTSENQKQFLLNRLDSRTVCLVCGRSKFRIQKIVQILHSIANGSPPLQNLRK